MNSPLIVIGSILKEEISNTKTKFMKATLIRLALLVLISMICFFILHKPGLESIVIGLAGAWVLDPLTRGLMKSQP